MWWSGVSGVERSEASRSIVSLRRLPSSVSESVEASSSSAESNVLFSRKLIPSRTTTATSVAVVVRLGISFRENSTLLSALDDDASTDSLTELGNRRKLTIDLEASLRSTPDTPDHHIFAIYDLDGFKRYNDTYGHPAGDSLLRRLATALRGAVGALGTAYRLGGDEFCV